MGRGGQKGLSRRGWGLWSGAGSQVTQLGLCRTGDVLLSRSGEAKEQKGEGPFEVTTQSEKSLEGMQRTTSTRW